MGTVNFVFDSCSVQCSPRPEGDSEVGKDGGAARGHVGEVRHGGGDPIPVDVGFCEVIFFVTGSGRDMVLAHQKLILNLMSVVNFTEPVGRAGRIRVMVVHSADAVVGDLQLKHEGGCVNPASGLRMAVLREFTQPRILPNIQFSNGFELHYGIKIIKI